MNPHLDELLKQTDRIMNPAETEGVAEFLTLPPVHVGVDLGTAYTVLVVLDELYQPIAAWFWYFISSLPYQIKVHGNVEIEFVSLLRRRRLSPMDIVSIKPDGSQFGFLLVKTNRGKIKLLNQFDGFHEFIVNLKAANPSIELRGC